MNRSRRDFLAAHGVAAIALGLAPAAVISTAHAAMAGAAAASDIKHRRKGLVMLEDLNQKTFESVVHSAFTVSDAALGRVTMTLAEVTGNASNPAIESFSLVFHGPREPLLPQKIYGFEHPQIGVFSLFIVPIGIESGGVVYQAIFNRLKPDPRTQAQ